MGSSSGTPGGGESVSIVIPTRDRFEPMRRALASARAQTHVPIEVVVVDDGSTDGSVRFLRGLEADTGEGVSVTTCFQPHAGAGAARNRGLDACRGEYVLFLDSDDVLRPGAVGGLVAAARSCDADVVCGAWREAHVAEGRVRLGPVRARPAAPDIVAQLLSLDGWSPNFCYLYRVRALEGVRWDESLRVGQDMDFVLRLAAAGARIERSDTTVGYYVHHTGARISGRPLSRWVESGLHILDRAVDALRGRGELTDARCEAAAESMWLLASAAATRDRGLYRRGLERALAIKSDFTPRRLHHRAAVALLGRAAAGVALDIARRIAPPSWARRRWA